MNLEKYAACPRPFGKYSDQFLSDFAMQCAMHGSDPRNRIGFGCGIKLPEVLQRHHDRWLESCDEKS